VQFDTNKAIVKDKYYDDIKRVADFMKEFPDTSASIEGHTDNIASMPTIRSYPKNAQTAFVNILLTNLELTGLA